MRQDQVSGGVSTLCWLSALVAMLYGNFPKFGNKVKIGNKVQFGNKFSNLCNVWSIEGVAVYGHVQECHVTFERERLHNGWWNPHIDQKTSLGTISNVPLYPVSNVANVENNELRLENNANSGHILLAVFSIQRTLVSHYFAFSSFHMTDANVLNRLNNSRLSLKRRRMQNNVTWGCAELRIMRGECDPKYRYLSTYTIRPGLLLVWMFYSEGQATFQ